MEDLLSIKDVHKISLILHDNVDISDPNNRSDIQFGICCKIYVNGVMYDIKFSIYELGLNMEEKNTYNIKNKYYYYLTRVFRKISYGYFINWLKECNIHSHIKIKLNKVIEKKLNEIKMEILIKDNFELNKKVSLISEEMEKKYNMIDDKFTILGDVNNLIQNNIKY